VISRRNLRAIALATPLLVGSAVLAGVPAQATGHPRDSALVEAVEQTSRSTPWTLTGKIKLNFPTFHPQGFARAGDRLFLSSVEVLEAPVKYPQPVDGYDRTPGRGRGHLFVLDLQGNLLRDIVLGEGNMYHPGGIDTDGRSLWVPVAEYRPDSHATIYRIDLKTLAASKAFQVDDHIGGIVPDPVTNRLYGVSWGSRTFYSWTRSGRQVERLANTSHFVDYQDCAYAEHRMMLCTGVTEYPTATGGKFELGGIALLDLASLRVRHEVPFQQWSSAGHVATRNPVLLESDGRTLRVWAAPDDGEEANGTEIFVYQTQLA
jgi:hypothetical protein